MKKIITITLTLLLALLVPTGFVSAWYDDTIQVKVDNSDIVNGLNGISNAITNSTKQVLDAQRQQQINALNQECVSQVTTEVRAQDGSVQTKKMIDDYEAQVAKMDTSWPSVYQEVNSHMSYLYTYIDRQNTQLYNVLIKYCTNYVPKTKDQKCQDSWGSNAVWSAKREVDGKAGCICKTGYGWSEQNQSCFAAVSQPIKTKDQICQDKHGSNAIWGGTLNDAGELICVCKQGLTNDPKDPNSCVAIPTINNLAPNTNNSVSSNISATNDIKSSESIIKRVPPVKEKVLDSEVETKSPPVQVASSTAVGEKGININTQSVVRSTWQKGLVQRAWEWAVNIFHF